MAEEAWPLMKFGNKIYARPDWPDDDGHFLNTVEPVAAEQEADAAVLRLPIDIPWPGQSLMEAFSRNVIERQCDSIRGSTGDDLDSFSLRRTEARWYEMMICFTAQARSS
jgi:hypothetical protein